MKTEKNILIAFILNLTFSIFEFVGGMLTGSVAIMSDAVHDVGDAVSIGIAYFFERKSKKSPDSAYTYGYARYSALGGLITTVILLFGSAVVIMNAINRLLSPSPINYNGMIIFAIIGMCVNALATFFTHKGESVNQKAVNLHMLEDLLGWIVVLIGAVVMRFTHFTLLDPIMSIGITAFIIVSAAKTFKEIIDIFLEKVPAGINVAEIKGHLDEIDGVIDVHHIHIWSMDGHNGYATMHVVTDGKHTAVKKDIREELKHHGITHVTLELESPDEICHQKNCAVGFSTSHAGHHHHHH